MTEQGPLVSIVIPVYNRADLVGRAISSALAQTYRNVEVVVSDNCSTDDTFDVMREYERSDPRVVVHRNQENLGAARNWIKGIQLSRGEYIRLLFSDDWMEPQSVEGLLAPLLEDPQIGFSYSAFIVHENERETPAHELKEAGRKRSLDFMRLLLNGYSQAPVTPDCAMFRRRDALQLIPDNLPPYKGFDVNVRGIGNDAMLYLRTCSKYQYCFYVDKPLTHCLAHPDSISVAVQSSGPFLLAWCYIQAFSLFLRDSSLPLSSFLKLSWDLRYYMFRLKVLEMWVLLSKHARSFTRHT